MSFGKGLDTFSRRGLRVVLFAWLLVALACACDDDNPISACLTEGGVSGCTMSVPASSTFSVSYLPQGSGSTGCSGNPAVVVTSVASNLFGNLCISGCEKICSIRKTSGRDASPAPGLSSRATAVGLEGR